MKQEDLKLIIAALTIAPALIFFAILTYTIFGWISDFNYTEAKADCNAYHRVESGLPDIIANYEQCLDDAQNTRHITNRIGSFAAGALIILSLGCVLWGIKTIYDDHLPHRVQLL